MGSSSESNSSQRQSQGSAGGRIWSESSSGIPSDDVFAWLLKWFKHIFSR